jgi:hypothetical protein
VDKRSPVIRAATVELKVQKYYSERSLFSIGFLAGFLGLWRATAAPVLSLRLQLPKVLRTALSDLLSPLPPKSNCGGILPFRQKVNLSYRSIMH